MKLPTFNHLTDKFHQQTNYLVNFFPRESLVFFLLPYSIIILKLSFLLTVLCYSNCSDQDDTMHFNVLFYECIFFDPICSLFLNTQAIYIYIYILFNQSDAYVIIWSWVVYVNIMTIFHDYVRFTSISDWYYQSLQM